MEKRLPARDEAMALLGQEGVGEASTPTAGMSSTGAPLTPDAKAAAAKRAAARWTIVDLEGCHALDIELHTHARALEDKALEEVEPGKKRTT